MTPIDVASFAAGWQAAWPGIVVGIAAFLVVAALATMSPALRALRIDPSVTLREE